MPNNFMYADYAGISWGTVSPSAENLMQVQAYYLTAIAEGRNVVTDSLAVYETDSSGKLVEVFPVNEKAKPTKQQPKKPALDVELLRYELKDTLLHLMKGQPKIIDQSYISWEQTLGDARFTHNYERTIAQNQSTYYINFKGKHLGVVQRFPHRKVTVYSQTEPKLRLVQRLFERVVNECLPEATVEVL